MKTYLFLAVVASLLFVSIGASAQMSDTEKKAAARAAYQEGIQLQEQGKFAEALQRFEAAQKLYDAPTMLLHIAECQALTGRLVEASETYELLSRKTIPAGSPEAYVQAQQQGQAELPALRARIPTLRVTTKPGPQQVPNLTVNVNGVNMPVELLGIARPLNPGTYRFSAQGTGWATAQSVDVPLAEKEQKSVELTLVQGGGGAVVVAPPPPPPPYGGNPDKPITKAPTGGPTSSGLLIGAHVGAVIPTGDVAKDSAFDKFAVAGGGGGLDVYARLAKMLLIGGVFEYASLGAPSSIQGIASTQSVDATQHTTYVGINVGIIPNVDKVSFIGDVGLGSRYIEQTLKLGNQTAERSAKGLEFSFGAGISIPVGPIRIVPKTTLGIGSFSSSALNGSSDDIPSDARGTHVFVMVGVAAFYSLDFGQKAAPEE